MNSIITHSIALSLSLGFLHATEYACSVYEFTNKDPLWSSSIVNDTLHSPFSATQQFSNLLSGKSTCRVICENILIKLPSSKISSFKRVIKVNDDGKVDPEINSEYMGVEVNILNLDESYVKEDGIKIPAFISSIEASIYFVENKRLKFEAQKYCIIESSDKPEQNHIKHVVYKEGNKFSYNRGSIDMTIPVDSATTYLIRVIQVNNNN